MNDIIMLADGRLWDIENNIEIKYLNVLNSFNANLPIPIYKFTVSPIRKNLGLIYCDSIYDQKQVVATVQLDKL